MKLSMAARHIAASSFGILWLALLGQSTALSQPVEESKIYWSQPELGIHRSDLDGSNVESLVVPDLRRPDKIALDVAGGKMYWSEKYVAGIHRSDLDGSNLEILVQGNGNPGRNGITGIALDLAGGKMYWAEKVSHGDYYTGIVARANLDGSDREVLAETLIWNEPSDIALDSVQDRVYLPNTNGIIYRADLDGKDLIGGVFIGDEHIIMGDYKLNPPGISDKTSIALDVDGGKMYWIHRGTQTIQRADLDGTNIEIVLTVSEGKLDEILLLDLDRGQIYWTNEGTKAIQVSDLDGNNVEHFFDLGQLYLTGSLADIGLDLDGGKIYFTDSGPGGYHDRGTGTIHRIDLNGQNGEVLFDPIVRHPYGIALDRDKIYWTDVMKGTIHRADLNGRNREVLFSGLNRPRDISLQGGNKVYWAAQGAGKIQAVGLDGLQVEDIVTGLDRPKIIALGHSKIFWTDRNTVFRSSLDGSHNEIITTMDRDFLDIALDRDRSKIYWTDNGSYENAKIIFRSNLDGSHRENLVTVEDRFAGSNQAIAIDPVRQKIYWTGWMRRHTLDWHSPNPLFMEIFRSNLDGSNVEKIHAVEVKYSHPSDPYPYPSFDIILFIPHTTSVSTSGTLPAVPITSGLEPNHPNPFNESTLIPYRLAASGPVRLEIYNILGQPVTTLVNEFRPAGTYHALWDARDGRGAELAAGVYLARLHHSEGLQTRRMIYLK